nr:RNA-directed DNA polymerase, eukaryota [Tanacetum cinerariifolium]
ASESSQGTESGGTHSRKPSRQMVLASPGRSGSGGKNTHIRKTRSAQMKFDLDDVGSGAALSRASTHIIEGEWVDDPSKVKDEFRDYFASRFCDPGIRHGVINFNFPNRLNINQSEELEAPISRDEIRRAVWDCGENKSPGPDGFTFEFFRRF